MKKRIKTFLATVFLVTALLSVSCKDKAEQKDNSATEPTEMSEVQGKEYTSAYVCPMHCEGSGSDSEGNCPKCGMAYVANEEHTQNGHTH